MRDIENPQAVTPPKFYADIRGINYQCPLAVTTIAYITMLHV